MATQTPSKNQLRGRLMAIFIVALFAASGIVATQPEAQAQADGLTIVASDMTTPVTTLRGSGAVGYVTVSSSTDNRDTTQRDVLTGVRVTSAAGEITISLLETEANSAVFHGQFGVATSGGDVPPASGATTGLAIGVDPSASSTGIGRVRVNAVEDSITVRLAGQTTGKAVTWFPSNTATLTVEDGVSGAALCTTASCRSVVGGFSGTVVVKVNDADLNTLATSAQEHVGLVRVWSESDRQGEYVKIREAPTVDSASFEATVSFESTLNPGNTAVHVRDGDRIYVDVFDVVDATGRPGWQRFPTAGEWVFKSRVTAAPILDATTYFGPPPTSGAPAAAVPTHVLVQVGDPDQNVGPGIDTIANAGAEFIVNGISRDKATFSLLETNGTSGFFVARIPITTNAFDLTNDKIDVGSETGGTIVVQYADPSDVTGTPRQTTARWVRATDPLTSGYSFTVANQANTPGTTIYTGILEQPLISLRDNDANRNPLVQETVTVTAKSTSSPTTGVQITLRETALDSDLFEGVLKFSTAGGGGTLKVADGDPFNLFYDDAVASNLNPKRFTAFSQPAIWRAATTATVTTDASEYFDAAVHRVAVRVVDADQNHPFQEDTVQITVSPGTGTAETVTLRESGIDSGVFFGAFNFTKSTSFASTATDAIIKVTPGQTTGFTIQYNDAFVPGSGATTHNIGGLKFIDNPASPVMRIERQFVDSSVTPQQNFMSPINKLWVQSNAGAETTFTVASYGTTKLRISSGTCTDGYDMTTGGTGARKIGSVKVKIGDLAATCVTDTNDDGDVSILAPNGGTITLRDRTTGLTSIVTVHQVRGSTEEGYPALTATAKAGKTETSTGTPAIQRQFVFGTQRAVDVQVTNHMLNMRSGLRDTAIVTVTAPVAGESALSLELVETGADTGVFTGGYRFTEGTASRQILKVTDTGASQTRPNPPTGCGSGNTKQPFHWTVATHAHTSPTVSRTACVGWYPGVDATLQIVTTSGGTTDVAEPVRIYGNQGTIHIRLTDDDTGTVLDSNNVEQRRRFVKVTSSAGETETITLQNVGFVASTPSTRKNVYVGSVAVETTAIANNQQILVGGDKTTLTLTFGDEAMTNGAAGSDEANHLRTISKTVTWLKSTTASIKFMDPTYKRELDSTNKHVGRGIPVRIVDKDSDTTPQRDQIIGQQGSTQVVLWETGKTTGIFDGTIPVASNVFSGTASLTYQDPRNVAGAPEFVPASQFAWEVAKSDAALIVKTGRSDQALGTAPFAVGTTGGIRIEVDDPDANRDSAKIDTVQVHVMSVRDLEGETYTLRETGVGTGVFQLLGGQQINFSLSAANKATKVHVLDSRTTGDQIWVTYEDQLDEDWDKRLVVSRMSPWRTAAAGSVSIGTDFLIGDTSQTAASGAKPSQFITVRDNDHNLDSRRVEVFQGTVDVGRLGSSGFFAGEPERLDVEFHETAANSGIFVGRLDVVANVGAKVDDLDFVADTASYRLMARYQDPDTNGRGGTVSVSSKTTWYPLGHGFPLLDAAAYTPSGTVGISVFDADHITSGATGKVEVQATSQRSPEGIKVTLAESTTVKGRFTGTITLGPTTSGTTTLGVNTADEINIRYSDNSPSQSRSVKGIVGSAAEGQFTFLTTVPSAPDGDNGWFKSNVTLRFQTTSAAVETWYQLDSDSEPTQYNNEEIRLFTNIYNITFWSRDVLGTLEDKNNVAIKIDTQRPSQQPANFTAQAAPGGAISLAWEPVAEKSNVFEFDEYRIYRGSIAPANLVGSSKTENFTDDTPADATYTYNLLVADQAGNMRTSLARTATATSDRIAPNVTKAGALKRELIEANGETTVGVFIELASIPTDFDKARVVATAPAGGKNLLVNLTRSGTSLNYTGTLTGFDVSGNYVLSFQALDQAGNHENIQQTVRFRGIDRVPPTVTVPAEVAKGSPLIVTVQDNDAGVKSVSYRLDGAAAVNVPVTGVEPVLTMNFTVPTAGLSLGDHKIRVIASDANGTANQVDTEKTFKVTGEAVGAPPSTTTPSSKPAISLPSALITAGSALNVRVAGSAVTVLTAAFDGGTATSVLASWSSSTGIVAVPTTGLEAGPHTVTIVATNAAGTTTSELAFAILESGVPMPPAFVVKKSKDGFPLLEWTPSTGAPVGGYLVHRSSSPYKVIADLPTDAKSFEDRTAKKGTKYQYAVTAYGTNGEGKLATGSDSESLSFFPHVATSQVVESDPAGGFFLTYWWVFLLLLAVIGAVVAVYVYRERLFGAKDDDEDLAGYDDYPDDSDGFDAPAHDLRCPNCTHEFTVTGEKPIVTTCPNCGKKGILR